MNIRIRMTGENYEEEVCLLIRAFLPEAVFLKQEDTESPADWECFFELQADSMTFRIENADGVLYREACGYDKEGELPEKSFFSWLVSLYDFVVSFWSTDVCFFCFLNSAYLIDYYFEYNFCYFDYYES